MDLLTRKALRVICIFLVSISCHTSFADGGCRGSIVEQMPCMVPWLLYAFPIGALPLTLLNWCIFLFFRSKYSFLKRLAPYLLTFGCSYFSLIALILVLNFHSRIIFFLSYFLTQVGFNFILFSIYVIKDREKLKT